MPRPRECGAAPGRMSPPFTPARDGRQLFSLKRDVTTPHFAQTTSNVSSHICAADDVSLFR